jgi:uncharacterized protein YllA (UPF0747 family)
MLASKEKELHNGAETKEYVDTFEPLVPDIYRGEGAVLLHIGTKDGEQVEASLLKLAKDRRVSQLCDHHGEALLTINAL